jgi:hypothetical protein
MSEFLRWLLERMTEPSTWRGLVWVATAAGIGISPEQGAAIASAGMALVGAINIGKKDEKNR